MLDLFLSTIFAFHLLCANVASAGPLYCIFLRSFAARSKDSWVSDVGRRLTIHSIVGLLLASLTGLLIGVVLWFKQDDAFFSSLSLFWPKIWWGSLEIIFSLVCYGAYWYLWPRAVRSPSMALTSLHVFIALLGTTNLLYHFPSLFGAIAYLARHPGQFESTLTPAQFRHVVYTGQILSLTVHFWLASIAVAGVYLMLICNLAKARESSPAAIAVGRSSARAALFVSLLQVPVGVWVLIQTDPLQQQSLLGGDIISTSFLGISVFLTFGLLHLLATMSFGDFTAKDVQKITVTLLLIVVLMSAALRRSRLVYQPESASGTISNVSAKYG